MTDNIFVDLSLLWEEIERYTTKWEDAGFTFPDAERCVAFIIEEASEAFSDYWRSVDVNKYLRNNDLVVDVDGEVADTLRMTLTLLTILEAPIDNFVQNSPGVGSTGKDVMELLMLGSSCILKYFRSWQIDKGSAFKRATIISTREVVQLCLRWFALRERSPERAVLEKMQQTDDKIMQDYWLNSSISL